MDGRGYVVGPPRPDPFWDRMLTAAEREGVETARILARETPLWGTDVIGFEVLALEHGILGSSSVEGGVSQPDLRINTWWTSDEHFVDVVGLPEPCGHVEEGSLPPPGREPVELARRGRAPGRGPLRALVRLLSNRLACARVESPDHRRGRLRRRQRRHGTRRAPSGLGADRARQPPPARLRAQPAPARGGRGGVRPRRCSQRRGAGGDRADRRADRVLGRALGPRRGRAARPPTRSRPTCSAPTAASSSRGGTMRSSSSCRPAGSTRTRRCGRWTSRRGRRALRFATRSAPRAPRPPGSPSVSGSTGRGRFTAPPSSRPSC